VSRAAGHLQGPSALHVPARQEARPDCGWGLDQLRRGLVRTRALWGHDRQGL